MADIKKKQIKKRAVIIKTAAITITAVIVLAVSSVCIIRAVCPVKYRDEVYKYSAKHRLEPEFIFAVIKTESGFKANAESDAGAIGLMQVMPETAAYIAGINGIEGFNTRDLYNAEMNIMIGCAYIRYLLDKFIDVKTAAAAYNAGEGNVAAWLMRGEYSVDGKTLKKIPFKETEQYIKKIDIYMGIYKHIL